MYNQQEVTIPHAPHVLLRLGLTGNPAVRRSKIRIIFVCVHFCHLSILDDIPHGYRRRLYCSNTVSIDGI